MKLLSIIFFAFVLRSTASTIPGLEAAKSKGCPGNTAQTRREWCDYNINTDYTSFAPNTGVTREYWFSIDEVTVSPDGVSRPAMAVNGTIPGPTIYADWGDEVVVHVTNHLNESKNGTSIHWHGIRQNYTNQNDGVVSITQCPTAPGSTMTYKWRAVQYGTTWWHSHIGLQAWEGVFGGIIINGPASSNYHVDKGVLFLNDWSHRTADELFTYAQVKGPPTLDTGLINGTNVYNSTGSRFTMRVKERESYRLRLINAAIDTHWKFMIDNHTLTVIVMDLVPIQPYTTKFINIGMGKPINFQAPKPDLTLSSRSAVRRDSHSRPGFLGQRLLDPRCATDSMLREQQRRQHQRNPPLRFSDKNTPNKRDQFCRQLR